MTTMLCKVLLQDTAEVSEAPWRRKDSQSTAGRRQHAGPHRNEPAADQTRIEELNALAERRAKEAFEQGVCAGEAGARKSLEDQVRAAVEALARSTEQVASTRADIMRRSEHDTVRLAIEIARRVLHRELSVDPSALGDLVSAALQKLSNQEIYRVRVHPEQEKLMRACLEQAGRASVEVIADPSQTRGGASFEISRGALDASVETQLREIENGLFDEMRRRA